MNFPKIRCFMLLLATQSSARVLVNERINQELEIAAVSSITKTKGRIILQKEIRSSRGDKVLKKHSQWQSRC